MHEGARKAGELDWLEVSRDDDFVGVQTYTRRRFGEHGGLEAPDGLPSRRPAGSCIPRPSGTPSGWPPSTQAFP